MEHGKGGRKPAELNEAPGKPRTLAPLETDRMKGNKKMVREEEIQDTVVSWGL